MTARDRILAKLRDALGPRDDAAARIAVEERLASRRAGIVPAVARTSGPERLAQFITKVQDTGATIERAGNMAEAGRCISGYLHRTGISPALSRVVAAPHHFLDEITLGDGMELVFGAPTAADRLGLSVADLGLAESGSLLFLSSAQSPASLHFVPETEIILVAASAIVAGMEDAWAYLRVKTQGMMPRAVHLVTGPSRTADIELTLTMGAHGPRNLHVVLLGAEGATGSNDPALT